MQPNEHCRIFDNADFGYRRVRVERPLRLNFHASPERLARLHDQPAFKALGENSGRRAAAAEGKLLQEAIVRALRRLPDRLSRDPAEFLAWLEEALAPLKLKDPLRKAILAALTERDESASPMPGKKGGYEPDPELRDYENVPLKEDVDAYFEREVKPFVADAWIDADFRDERDERVGVVGYEINFNRYFYKYTPPPPPDALLQALQTKEREIAALLQGWLR